MWINQRLVLTDSILSASRHSIHMIASSFKIYFGLISLSSTNIRQADFICSYIIQYVILLLHTIRWRTTADADLYSSTSQLSMTYVASDILIANYASVNSLWYLVVSIQTPDPSLIPAVKSPPASSLRNVKLRHDSVNWLCCKTLLWVCCETMSHVSDWP